MSSRRVRKLRRASGALRHVSLSIRPGELAIVGCLATLAAGVLLASAVIGSSPALLSLALAVGFAGIVSTLAAALR